VGTVVGSCVGGVVGVTVGSSVGGVVGACGAVDKSIVRRLREGVERKGNTRACLGWGLRRRSRGQLVESHI
jgi:outer membrane lipoprotein SlyB